MVEHHPIDEDVELKEYNSLAEVLDEINEEHGTEAVAVDEDPLQTKNIDAENQSLIDYLIARLKDSVVEGNPADFVRGQIGKALGVREWKKIDRHYPSYLLGVVHKTFEKYQDKDVKINNWDQDLGKPCAPAEYEFVIAPGVKEHVLVTGYRNMSIQGTKLVMKVGYASDGGYFFTLYYDGNKQDAIGPILEKIDLDIRKNNFFKGQTLVFGSGQLRITEPHNQPWESVILPEVQKDKIYQNTILFIREKDALAKRGVSVRRGVLLSGPPGCGKTATCRAVASELKITTIWVTGNSIGRVQDIISLFNIAKDLGPTLIIMEDVDGIGFARGEGGTNPLLSELLTQMDGFSTTDGVIVLATTNNPFAVDSALRDRPSRFDRHFSVAPPDETGIVQMFKLFIDNLKVPNKLTDTNLQNAAKRLAEIKGISGAYVREVILTANVLAMRASREEISEQDLMNATAEVKESGTKTSDVMAQ